MTVCGADAWYIAVVIFGKGFRYYKLERDEEMIADLIRIEQDFWENHVLKRQIPSPDGSKLADSVIAEYYKQTVAETIPLTGFNEKIKRRQELSEIIGKMDTEKRQIEQELKLYLGEAEIAENEQYRVSWKAVESKILRCSRNLFVCRNVSRDSGKKEFLYFTVKYSRTDFSCG